MSKMKTILMLGAILVFVAGPAAADWDPGDGHKMHYPQLPDLDYGLDVLAGWDQNGLYQKALADDWMCTKSGPVTDIHIWGSYLYDLMVPGVSVFRLAIYNDIPNGPNGHSVPGELLWEDVFDPSRYIDRLYAEAYERFFDPNQNEIIGFDNQVWQYNFDIDPEVAFFQEEGNIYWLSVTELTGEFVFGWKTSYRHWNDDAVFTDKIYDPTPWDWHELYDPESGVSLDMAFVITPEPGTMCLLMLGGIGILVRRRRRV